MWVAIRQFRLNGVPVERGMRVAAPPSRIQRLVNTRHIMWVEETDNMTEKRYVACRSFKMAGKQIEAGQVIDTTVLPPGKKDVLVRTRYLEEQEVAEPKRKRGRPRKNPVAAAG